MIRPQMDRQELRPTNEPDWHPSVETVVRYLDDTMIPEDRNVLEHHLNECSRCRDELVDARGTLRKLRRRRYMTVATPVAAAASLVVLFQLASSDQSATSDEFRAGGLEAVISAVEPVEGAVTTDDSVRFVWSASGPSSASFVLTVTDSAGNRLYEISTADTVAVVRQEEFSAAAGTFLWFVDALFEDGRSARTGINRFRLR